ncbi:hypothetical protein ACFL3A_07975 [Pseudomonadota bacterium]
MKTLMIKDLTANVELDSKAMTAVSGGLYLGHVSRPYRGGPKLSLSVTDIDTTSVIADQNLAQVMNVSTVTGANAAFVDHLQSNVFTSQQGANNISIA